MKKVFGFLWILSWVLVSCGGDKPAPTPQTTNTTNTATTHSNPQPDPVASTAKELSKDEKMNKGKEIYARICQACHQADGKGIENAFPPVAQSDYMESDLNRAMHGVANGLSGEITVNGKKYNSAMPKPSPELTDEELASVFTYILNSFGNKGGEVSVAQAAEARK